MVLAVSAIVGLSAIAGIAAAAANRPSKWFMLAFETVILLAAGFGIAIGGGRILQGKSLGLLCVAGAVFACSVLGYVGASKQVLGFGLMPILAARLSLAGLLAVAAGFVVIGRQPARTLPPLLRGVGCGIGAVAVVAGAYLSRQALGGLNPVITVTLGFVLSMLTLGLLAAAVHLIIRAFEIGQSPASPAASSV